MDMSKSYCYDKMNHFNQKVWELVDSSCQKSCMGRLLGTPAVILTNVVYISSIFADIGETFIKFAVNTAKCKGEEDGLMIVAFGTVERTLELSLVPLHSFTTGVYAPAGTLIGGSKVAKQHADFYQDLQHSGLVNMVADKCFGDCF